MVDAERLARILSRVSADVTSLASTKTHGLASDDLSLRAVKYTFVTAIEGCVRAAQHVLSSEGLGVPDSNAAAVRLLGDHGVVDLDLATSIARAVGFRNVLVHEYTDVDDLAVVANLSLVGDLDRYVVQLSAWAAQQ